MSELEAELRAALSPAAAGPQEPPCALDLEAARFHGRRLRRRRQRLQAGAAMAATALVAVLAAGSLSGSGGPAVAPASPTAGSGGEPAHDPVTTGVTYGWLPSGFRITGGGTEGAFNGDLVAGNGKTTLFVSVQPLQSGGGDRCGSLLVHGSSSAPPISSCAPSPAASGLHDLRWVAAPGSSQAIAQHYARLDWQMPDGRAAALFASPGDETADQLAAIMIRVAENVRLGGRRALPMPFHLAKPPTELPLAYGFTSQGPDGIPPGAASTGGLLGTGPAPGVAAGLEYSGLDARIGNVPSLELAVRKAVPDAAFPDKYEIEIGGGPPAAADIRSTTVDGHPARIATKAGDQVLVVHDVNGFDVRLAVGGAEPQAVVDAAGGIVGYFHTITFFGTDPATWTVDVLGG